MSKVKKDEDAVEIIPLNDRISELEDEVKIHLENSVSLPLNKTKFSIVEHPHDASRTEMREWMIREINRCRNGYGGLTGKMYFYYNYCYIQSLKAGGRIRPEFRMADNEWFKAVTEAQESGEWGVVCVKRRRVGASWKEAADVAHDLMFNQFFNVGMNSKSDADSLHLFNKFKFIYDNLPSFMKASVGSKNGMNMEFYVKSKDDNGNDIKTGNQSQLIVRAPTDSAFEGLMMHKWICDEAGKIDNLEQLWSYTEDCLMQEMKRVGTPVLFGTSGDISKNGKGLMDKWDNSEIYKLRRFFFAGWMGLSVDEYGNDHKEDTIRWLVYERKRREGLSKKEYIDFIQKYPLTDSEAFSKFSKSGLGDPVSINMQMSSLRKNPPLEKRGKFRFDENWNVKFIPDRHGPVIIYEEPDPHSRYIGGCDPADHDEVSDTASDLSTHIFKHTNGIDPVRVVAEYVDRPKFLTEYYNQAICLSIYYGNAKLLVEDNRFRMISHFVDRDMKKLLHFSPPAINRLFKSKPSKLGIRMSNEVKEFMEGVINDYLEDNHDIVPSIPLLTELLEYGSKNTDRVMSFGIGLILARSTMKSATKKSVSSGDRRVPSFSYVKGRNGQIKRVNK